MEGTPCSRCAPGRQGKCEELCSFGMGGEYSLPLAAILLKMALRSILVEGGGACGGGGVSSTGTAGGGEAIAGVDEAVYKSAGFCTGMAKLGTAN